MTIADRYRRWFQYEKDSHAKMLASLLTVPESARSQNEYRKAIGLAGHLSAARRLWLYRMGFLDRGPAHFFPTGLTVREVREELEVVDGAWEKYFESLDDAELEREFEYQSLEGEHYRNRVEDILAQLFGHSWYHRGQIALLVRRLGGVPAVTDLVFWTREQIPPPG